MLEKLTNDVEKLEKEEKSKITGGRNCLRPCVERCYTVGTGRDDIGNSGLETGSVAI